MLVPRIIAILMCLQVLVCPVLCNDFCDFHEQFGSAPSQLEVPPACHCCDSGTSEGGGSDAPCDPSSECCNCFCGGALVSETDSICDLHDFVVLDFAVNESYTSSMGQADCAKPADHLTDRALVFGRAILRAYSILQI
jgi:hypothetical protein